LKTDSSSERLETVPPAYITAFLRSRGWRLEERRDEGERWVLIDSQRDRFGSVLVPSDLWPDRGWRQARLHVLADEITGLEGISSAELFALITSAGRDTVRIRVVADQTESGEIPLDYATDLVTSVVSMVESAARACYRPHRRYQSGRLPDTVREFMQTARLGQTEAGSYVVTVHAPLPPEQLTLDATPTIAPFARLAMATLDEAVHAAHDLGESATPGEDAVLDAVDAGMTLNLLNALARLRTDEVRADAEVSTSWSPAYGGRRPSRQMFSAKRLRHLNAISQALASEPEEDGFEISGTVEGVRYVPTLDAVGRVSVRAEVRGRERTVVVDVSSEDDYKRLADAHIQRRNVRLRGRLIPGGRRYVALDGAEIVSS